MTIFNNNKLFFDFGKQMIFIAIALFIIAVGIIIAFQWRHPNEIYGFKISTIIKTLDLITRIDAFIILAISIEYWLTFKIEIDETTGNISIIKPNQQNTQIYSPVDLKEFKIIYSYSRRSSNSLVILTKADKEINLHISNRKKQQQITEALSKYSHLPDTTEPYDLWKHNLESVKSGIAIIQKDTGSFTKFIVILILLIGSGIITSFLLASHYYYGK